ncbi:protein mono-ADP-ribosyltransferase PARP6 isoform X2 [Ictalurus furcatus]|uniref:protein mono-ADP-ribosyltransferase PARP6 isoform X2 n=1 Tax=Ictalurus furcatus TaxID=66913 RepID=UPI00234FDFFB|nr:protein mono-ADP-ribosyltransferase PARP6 isoform X2 [Ictalurus furcatus]
MINMSVSGQCWSDEESDGDIDCENIIYGAQGNYAADLYCHPQLDTDVGAVKDIYSDNAVGVREYEAIDDVDIDLHINISFLDEEVASAWKVNRTEPIVLRLRFSLSQYLDGPEPTVEVFQPSCKDSFSVGVQLKRCPNVPLIQGPGEKGRTSGPEPRVSRLMSRSASCTMKMPKGDLLTYAPNGQNVAVPGSRSTVQITTKQLIELFFSSQALLHCKSIPTLEYGFLVQIMKYSEQRIPTLNEYCVVCDEQHVFQNGSMLKPAVCTRELCVFSYYTLGVMSGAVEDVATGAEVVDLLVAMCRAALESSRKSIIFDPYPSVVDPFDPKALAFNPKKRSYDRLQKALDSIMSIREITQGSYVEIKKQMDKLDPLAHPLLQWIISSNRSHIVKLPLSRQLKFMHTTHQFLLLSSPPAKEARFRTARKLYGSTFAFHGSHIENWHSILRNGLVNASYTKLQLHGAAYGKGIYLSPISSISFGYSGMGKGQHHMPTKEELVHHYNRVNTISQSLPVQSRFLQSRNLNCVALCEVITSKDLQKHGNIWVCPVPDHVCTRFFFVYEDGQVGDANINTQEARIQREILRVIGTQSS